MGAGRQKNWRSGTYIEEIDNGHKGGVEDCPDDVEFPLQRLDAGRRDFHHHEVEDPVRGGTESGAFGAHGQRVDFCRVEPLIVVSVL